MKKATRGGTRQGSGAKPKYGEPAKHDKKHINKLLK